MAGGPNTHDNRDDNRHDGDGESVRDQGDPSGAGSVDGGADGVADSGLVDSGLPERARLRLAPVTDPVLVELVEWETERRRLDARRAELLVAADRSKVCDLEHGHTTAGWVAATSKLGSGPSRVLVRTSRRLVVEFPDLHAALARGDIAWHHVEVFLRAANPRIGGLLAQVVPELVDLATVATFDDWARAVRRIAERLDVDGGYDPAADPANNHLSLSTGFDGTLHLNGQFVGELALIIKSVLTAHTQQIRDRYAADARVSDGEIDIPGNGQLAAEALADLFDAGAAAHKQGSAGVVEPEVVVLYNADTGELADADGTPLSAAIIRWVLAAGLLRPFEVTERGDVLRAGHLLRYANRHQRRALTVRDGGCVFDGCTRKAVGTDAHHVDEWNTANPAEGGPTDIEWLALLCRHHHRVTHRPGWLMQRWTDPNEPDAIVFRWITPAGRVIYSQRHGITWTPAQAA